MCMHVSPPPPFPQQIINHLRQYSHSMTYSTAMSAPVARQIISCFRIIMGEDGTDEGEGLTRHLV